MAGSLSLNGDAVNSLMLDWLVEHVGEVVGLAPRLAYDLIGNAMENLPGDDSRFTVLQDHLALVALHLGRFRVSESTARSILARSRDPERRGHALWNLGYALQRQGRTEEGLGLVAEAILVDGDDVGIGENGANLRRHVGQVVAGEQRRREHGPHGEVGAILGRREIAHLAVGPR